MIVWLKYKWSLIGVSLKALWLYGFHLLDYKEHKQHYTLIICTNVSNPKESQSTVLVYKKT